jgi:hypothetical protein
MTSLTPPTDRLDAHVRAWNTNDPADIAGLFTADTTYRGAPYEPGPHGVEAIVADWLARQDQPRSTVD